MTVSDFEKQLLDAAVNQLNNGRDWLRLELNRPASGSRMMVALEKPRVKGEVLCENHKGNAVVLVKASEVLKWCESKRHERVAKELFR